MASFDLRNNSEKRDFLRVETDTPVEVLYQGNTLTGTCKDLSATGLQVEMPIALSLNADVTICIKPNDMSEKLPPFRANATVARRVPNENCDTTYGLVINEILE
jgi:hypothetical protein